MSFREVHAEWMLALADHEARMAKYDATRKSVEGLMVEMDSVASGRLSSLAERALDTMRCACPCQASDGRACPSCFRVWQCRKCKATGDYVPECNFPRHEYQESEEDCRDPESIMYDQIAKARRLAENSPKALLKKARKIRDTAKELRARAARNIKRAKALERRARATSEVQPVTLIPWICNGR